MATIVIPFRPNGKRRLAERGPELARAMLADVLDACSEIAPTVIADAESGQGAAVQEVLARLDGAVAVVNADLPCARPEDVERLLAETPPAGLAIVEAADGTTNAVSVTSPGLFVPLYGPRSAERFRAAGARTLVIENLADDVDTEADLERLAARVGSHTRAVL